MQGLQRYGNGEMGESDFRFHGGGSDGDGVLLGRGHRVGWLWSGLRGAGALEQEMWGWEMPPTTGGSSPLSLL